MRIVILGRTRREVLGMSITHLGGLLISRSDAAVAYFLWKVGK